MSDDSRSGTDPRARDEEAAIYLLAMATRARFRASRSGASWRCGGYETTLDRMVERTGPVIRAIATLDECMSASAIRALAIHAQNEIGDMAVTLAELLDLVDVEARDCGGRPVDGMGGRPSAAAVAELALALDARPGADLLRAAAELRDERDRLARRVAELEAQHARAHAALHRREPWPGKPS